MPANILNLPAYGVTAIEEAEHDYHVSAETKNPPKVCPHCRSDNLHAFGRREQMIKDLPMHGKRVGIYIDTRRYKCLPCSESQGKTITFYEALPEIDEKRLMTKRLVAWMGRQAIKRTFASIAEEVGCTEFTVRAVFSDYVNELEKTIRFETPKWMGIDEIHLIRPRGVIANIDNNTIVELLSNRNKETMVRYLSRLEGRERVQYVAMDMWHPYKDAVEAVIPDTRIVIDKFHVVRMANDALERVRKSLREQLTPKQRRGLMHDRFVLLKRERDLNDQERLLLSGWIKNYPELGLAYRLKEDFFAIYDAPNHAEALARYSAWNRAVTAEVRDAYGDLIRAFQNWMPYILAYFDHPITNAYTESLNNLIRVMNRLGRGYSFEALRAKILFAEGAFKRSRVRPLFARKAPRRQVEAEVVRGVPADSWGFMMYRTTLPPAPRMSEPDGQDSTLPEAGEKNYGVEISALVRMIENGEL